MCDAAPLPGPPYCRCAPGSVRSGISRPRRLATACSRRSRRGVHGCWAPFSIATTPRSRPSLRGPPPSASDSRVQPHRPLRGRAVASDTAPPSRRPPDDVAPSGRGRKRRLWRRRRRDGHRPRHPVGAKHGRHGALGLQGRDGLLQCLVNRCPGRRAQAPARGAAPRRSRPPAVRRPAPRFSAGPQPRDRQRQAPGVGLAR